MEKDQTARAIGLAILFLSIAVGLVVGVVFIARALGLIALYISVDLFSIIHFDRAFTAQEGLIVGMITLLVWISLAYISLKILRALTLLIVAVFVSMEILGAIAYFFAARGFPDLSILFAVMPTSWWLFLYLIGPEIESREQD